MQIGIALGVGVLGYLFGSISFAYLITKIMKGDDVRDKGSHHATTTNTIRQAGWGAGVVVFGLDIAKGYFPTYLALQVSDLPWAAPFAAGLAVAGHCWPIFFGFRGGMGLATAGGAILNVYPLGFVIGLGILIVLTLLLKHSARAGLFTGLSLLPAFYLMGERGVTLWLASAVGAMIAIRFLSDWNRKYRELWLDREKVEAE